MPIDSARFRQVLGHFASGVTVITTAYQGKNIGMTVSSFSSLSLEPPLILFCVDQRLSTHEALLSSGKFVVNILSREQEHLSRQFASREQDKFMGVAHYPGVLGVPILEGTIAAIECQLHSTAPGGDHTILIGEVIAAQIREGEPLLYYRGGYREMK